MKSQWNCDKLTYHGQPELTRYLSDTLSQLKARIRSDMTPEQEKELEAAFVRDYFYEPMMYSIRKMAISDINESLPLSTFHQMQKVIRELFPYWVDNDRLFEMGKEVLEVLSLSFTEITNEEALRRKLGQLGESLYPRPYVSVVLPTFNGVKYLHEAVESVLSSSYERLELLVVDDGSTKDIKAAIKDITDDRVRYIRSEPNGGLAHARNVGICEAKYDYIAFCDDDDLWHTDKLEKQMKSLLSRGEDFGFAYCEAKYIRADETEALYVPRREISLVRKDGYIYPELLRRNYIDGPTLLVRKKCFEEIGFYDEKLRIFEDWDMNLRLAKQYKAAFVAEPLYDYFERSGSLTTERSREHMERCRASIERINRKIAADRQRFGMEEYEMDL